ncbi:MAG TPA: glycosyltransferase [Caulobacteraceae bacterium]|nr:glycosyltransferase [Caulobacteraceae bacterium]
MGELARGPIIISGFFRDSRGVAQAARLIAAGLRAAGLVVIEHDVTYLVDRRLAREDGPRPRAGVWLIACNPEEALAILDQHRELSEAPLYRIGAWVWELPVAPDSWIRASGLFHEIWGPSRFCATAFSRAEVPTFVMPYPVPLQPPASTVATNEGPVRFTVFADLRSGAARKNPTGAVTAYLEAFPKPGAARLLVKLLSPDADPAALTALKGLIADRADVDLVVEALSEAEMAELYQRTDIVLSLHRSEGYGLTLAEAMAAGKAVAATGWSGNLEFMTGEAARQLIPHTLVPVNDPSGLYADAAWAEPDVAKAVDLIRGLARNPELRRSLADANRAAMEAINRQWTAEALAGRAFLDLSERTLS